MTESIKTVLHKVKIMRAERGDPFIKMNRHTDNPELQAKKDHLQKLHALIKSKAMEMTRLSRVTGTLPIILEIYDSRTCH